MLDTTTNPITDPRIIAMAREWCRILGKDPDEPLGRGYRRAPRWLGYAHLMVRLLEAIDRDAGSA